MTRLFAHLWAILLTAIVLASCVRPGSPAPESPKVYPEQNGFVDANGVLIYYSIIGHGDPLIILHGGPGASHDYFLPYLLPLARNHRLVFIDERGSGRSEKLEDPKGYTNDAMVEDVETVRVALGLGDVDMLGHSCGGVLAQGYALKYQSHLRHLVLCSTFQSTSKMNKVFIAMKEKMPKELRDRIDAMEASGLFGKGKEYEQNRYTAAYMVAAWGDGYFPYLYQNHPDPNYSPEASGVMSWDLYREMWGSHGEFVIDGNLSSIENDAALPSLKVPTLITVGDHDECDPSLAREMHSEIAGSELTVFPKSGHMTFVDQPAMFIRTIDAFLRSSGKD